MSLSGGAGKAARIAGETADKNNAISAQVRDDNKAILAPTVNRGNDAGSAYNALLGLGGDPKAANDAFQTYENSTGHDFRLKQGGDALGATAFAKGGGLSGAALRAATEYGQNFGTGDFQTYLGNLDNQERIGLSGASALAGVGNTYASNVTANNNNAATAAENAAKAKAAGLNSLIGTGIGLASSFASGGGTSALKFLGAAG